MPVFSKTNIADYNVAKENVFTSIPVELINRARTELAISYQHSSYETHVSLELYRLQDKRGDMTLGFSLTPEEDKLELLDEKALIQTTKYHLDAPENATVNVILWSWCNITNHHPNRNYLPGMDNPEDVRNSLINDLIN